MSSSLLSAPRPPSAFAENFAMPPGASAPLKRDAGASGTALHIDNITPDSRGDRAADSVNLWSSEPPVGQWSNLTLPVVPGLLENVSRTFPGFTPPLHTAPDGSRLLVHMAVQSCHWLPMLLNALLSLQRNAGVYNVTVLTGSACVQHAVQLISGGLYAHDPAPWLGGLRGEMLRELPNWSWGAIAVNRLQINTEALRRGVGACTIDVDAHLSDASLFEGTFDIAIQGKPEHLASPLRGPPKPGPYQRCSAGRWSYMDHRDFSSTKADWGFYVNQGMQCMRATTGTVALTRLWMRNAGSNAKQRMFGWLQPAHVQAFCEAGFRWTKIGKRYGTGVLTHFNASVRVVIAGPQNNVMINRTDGISSRGFTAGPLMPITHVKGCHDKGTSAKSSIAVRVMCKMDALKRLGAWVLPETLRFPDLDADADEWIRMLNAQRKELAELLTDGPERRLQSNK